MRRNEGIAHWQSRFRQVDSGDPFELDGIQVAIFDDSGLCIDYKEWSHCREMNHVD
ncbi:MAG: hypothetical protein WA997_18285 [Anaerolineales bacterium]